MKSCTKILVKAFSSLTKKQKANLLWHHDKKTRIMCAENYVVFISDDGKGG